MDDRYTAAALQIVVAVAVVVVVVVEKGIWRIGKHRIHLIHHHGICLRKLIVKLLLCRNLLCHILLWVKLLLVVVWVLAR